MNLNEPVLWKRAGGNIHVRHLEGMTLVESDEPPVWVVPPNGLPDQVIVGDTITVTYPGPTIEEVCRERGVELTTDETNWRSNLTDSLKECIKAHQELLCSDINQDSKTLTFKTGPKAARREKWIGRAKRAFKETAFWGGMTAVWEAMYRLL